MASLLVLGSAGLLPAGALAQAPPSTAGGEPAAADPVDAEAFPLVEDPRLAPPLWAVPVEGAEVEAALSRYRTTTDELATATAEQVAADDLLVALGAAEERLVRRATEVERRRAKSATRLEELGATLRALVVADFVRGGTGSSSDAELDLTDPAANAGRRTLVRAAVAEQLTATARHARVVTEMGEAADVTSAELAEVRRRLGETTAARDRAAARREQLTAQQADDGVALSDARLTSLVAGTDLPVVALDAYVRAAAVVAFEDPDCRLEWSLLAGIGRTESRHGTYGGAVPQPDGTLSEPILGIALDGTRSATIADTDGGALDTDPVWDRAVGPMQFIPSTWTRWARDGDGDEEADPQDLHDATLTAGAYLCATARDLDVEPGARRALRSYNNSTPYADTVLERAAGYAEAVAIGPTNPPPGTPPAPPPPPPPLPPTDP